MKKVLVLVAALSLFAAPAIAGIAGTAHDLSTAGAGTDEICVFCHTPHGADITVADAPLWNRTNVSATAVYNTPTLDATITVGSVNNTDAPLCLSCHDGASIQGVLQNPPNVGTFNAGSLTEVGANANIGGDTENLSNDHPIGFSYTAVAAADGGSDTEIRAKATAEATLGGGTANGALSYGSGNDMWCSSCHDVHNDSMSPFLRISNSGSALCLACHIK